jgi:hypothetical protein
MEPHRKRWLISALMVTGLTLTGLGGATPLLAGASVAPPHAHLGTSPALAQDAVDPAAASAAVEPSIERLAFQDEMRRLWEDHVTWTRLYIVSFAADLPDQDATARRLLRNQADIGNAVTPFYGEEAGAELTRLLEGHILGAVDLLQAAKSGDQTAAETASAAWYANADEIAAFLSAANPEQWPQADLQAEMRMHLDITLREATARLTGDFTSDIAAYDEVHAHILAFADVLSRGIMQQFPERFA